MLQKYSFFCVFALLLTGLHWWSSHVDLSVERATQSEANGEQGGISQVELRRELLENLDRLVLLENYYRSIYGHYTQVLNHAGFSLPPRLARHYEIQVTSAAKDHFQVSAFSEEQGRIRDRVWVDQLFRVTANFPIPVPSAEYLKLRAIQHLNILREQSPERVSSERGIFTGYFQFEIRKDSNDHPVAIATGVKSPVQGLQLESEPKKTSLGEVHEAKDFTRSLGFMREVGQYAQEWTELAQMAESQSGETVLGQSAAIGRHLAGSSVSVGDGDELRPLSDRLVIESVESVGSVESNESRSGSTSHKF